MSTLAPDPAAPTAPLTPRPVRVAAGFPVAVLPPDRLPRDADPVLVTVRRGARAVHAWAWSGDDPALPPAATGLAPGEVGVSQRLGSALGGPPEDPVEVTVPRVRALRVLSVRIDDMPGPGEVQVSPADRPAGPARALLVHEGVAAVVTAVPAEHVPAGSVRMSYATRVLQHVAENARVHVVDLPAPVPGGTRWAERARRATGRGVERALRAVFRAPSVAVRVTQAHAGDDETAVVALHASAFERLGIRPGDQVLVAWGAREVVALAVTDHEPHGPGGPLPAAKGAQRVNLQSPPLPDDFTPHLVARLSAPARRGLGCPPATVVTVRRRVRPALARNLNQLVVPAAGLLLAGAALPDPSWLLLGGGTVVISALALASVRIPAVGRRPAPTGDELP